METIQVENNSVNTKVVDELVGTNSEETANTLKVSILETLKKTSRPWNFSF